jgi:hypothetical protein
MCKFVEAKRTSWQDPSRDADNQSIEEEKCSAELFQARTTDADHQTQNLNLCCQSELETPACLYAAQLCNGTIRWSWQRKQELDAPQSKV